MNSTYVIKGQNQNFVNERNGESLKALQTLRESLNDLYERNVRIDEENSSLKKEVSEMRKQVGHVLEIIKVLKKDLRKVRDLLKNSDRVE